MFREINWNVQSLFNPISQDNGFKMIELQGCFPNNNS